ncbi:MAG: hypothetical protein JWP65_2475 [Ramlibacter sp.]|nr:hypothetical protein [Ramlibacter sp.]
MGFRQVGLQRPVRHQPAAADGEPGRQPVRRLDGRQPRRWPASGPCAASRCPIGCATASPASAAATASTTSGGGSGPEPHPPAAALAGARLRPLAPVGGRQRPAGLAVDADAQPVRRCVPPLGAAARAAGRPRRRRWRTGRAARRCRQGAGAATLPAAPARGTARGAATGDAAGPGVCAGGADHRGAARHRDVAPAARPAPFARPDARASAALAMRSRASCRGSGCLGWRSRWTGSCEPGKDQPRGRNGCACAGQGLAKNASTIACVTSSIRAGFHLGAWSLSTTSARMPSIVSLAVPGRRWNA